MTLEDYKDILGIDIEDALNIFKDKDEKEIEEIEKEIQKVNIKIASLLDQNEPILLDPPEYMQDEYNKIYSLLKPITYTPYIA